MRRRVASVAIAAAFYVKPHVVERLIDSKDSENSTKLQLRSMLHIQTSQGEKAANKSMNLSSMKIDLIWL